MRLRFALLWAPILCATSAMSAELYQCKGKQGEKVYQNTACPADEPQVSAGHYQPTPDQPRPGYPAAGPKAPAGRTPASPVVNTAAPQGLPAYRAPIERQPGITGFQCSTKNHAWVQQVACPKSTNLVVDNASGAVTGDSGITYTTGNDWVMVREIVLGRDELCELLRQRSRIGMHSLLPGEYTYERNRLMRDASCDQ